jgi:outer membrane lipoprotein
MQRLLARHGRCTGRTRYGVRLTGAVMPVMAALAIAGCAGTPQLDLENANRTVRPAQVAANLPQYRSRKVLWGGVIIDSRNVKHGSELQVLAYPLKGNLKPDTHQRATGRFIAFTQGYLETVDYAPGRVVTLVGTVEHTTRRSIGEVTYLYPVVRISQLHLWPAQDAREGSRIRFGVGVGVTVH